MIYACQVNVWMDEDVMHMWIQQVLRPYLSTTPDGIEPILFLDAYRCHIMAEVVQAIQDLGCEVQIIPGGCTGLCQPVNVGTNKPLKGIIRGFWEEWMATVGLGNVEDNGKIPPPTRKDISTWCSAAFKAVPVQNIINAWRRTGPYTWFLLTCEPKPLHWIERPVGNADDKEEVVGL